MIKRALLTSLLFYLISCTSSDNTIMQSNDQVVKTVKISLGTGKSEKVKIKEFSDFLSECSKQQIIPAYEFDLHEKVKTYLPDSIRSEGFDLHIHEIGRIDTFRLVFHEYFDLYDDWSNTYLDIFSPSGELLRNMRMWELSFEGSTNINFINNEIIEIAYHDFFNPEDSRSKALVPEHNFYLEPTAKNTDKLEGTIYEYYKILKGGALKNLSQNIQVSKDRRFPQSSAKLLSASELKQYTLEEIRLMKDEILAEHGHVFSDFSTQNYFESQNWYLARPNYTEAQLTDIEALNFKRLSNIEKEY